MPVKNRLADLHDEIAGWRHHLHRHPELLYEVHGTAAFVTERLREIGVDEITTGVGRTGVVAVVRGRSDRSGRVIGLRADMDALPIHEATGLAHASTNAGVMHACGHDGHTAMLLGAAKYLAETRNFDGTAVLIFQPAEEGGAGGKAMCDDGLMERWGIDEVYGLHNAPGLPAGSFHIRPGPMMAATDEFEIVLEGRGGHAARPHQTVDTAVMACHLGVALQTVTSRNADPVEQLVLSVTSIESSTTAFNVIPQRVTLRGTVRSMVEPQRAMARRRLREITEGIAASLGGTAAIDFPEGYPVLINAPEPTAHAAAVARDVAGDCALSPMVMGGEDFSYMLQERPGAYMRIGNGDTAALHNPAYDFDDEIIPAGCSWLVGMIEARMPAG
ncbi:M20 aminoacylase family protein [Sedimentitalea arenosa]|uniref:Amidohydrolase n=1 Tax=Sedimentitalea arenosa TaxID=2798803 RepID=A0A8J7IH51_9RHOB|nr:M20 aminoacylase family protein [Arenibacterium arenosum]MBJ6370037.1 amidohydrolase [Arenibacterium arenosum]